MWLPGTGRLSVVEKPPSLPFCHDHQVARSQSGSCHPYSHDPEPLNHGNNGYLEILTLIVALFSG